MDRISLRLAAAVICAPFAFAGAALARDKVEDILSKYEKTGESVDCLTLSSVRDTDALDDYTLLVRAGGDVYLNELSGRCIGLGREDRFQHKTSLGRMCKGDIIRVLDSFGSAGGSCGLGAFEKLSKIEEPQE